MARLQRTRMGLSNVTDIRWVDQMKNWSDRAKIVGRESCHLCEEALCLPTVFKSEEVLRLAS
jgi:hypothetical protein